jgi:hypothetical protein
VTFVGRQGFLQIHYGRFTRSVKDARDWRWSGRLCFLPSVMLAAGLSSAVRAEDNPNNCNAKAA